MSWRVAASLLVLRDQVDALRPGRSRASDGTVADANHPPSSDHTPKDLDAGEADVVTALDITDDGNTLGRIIWAALLGSRDPRVKYLIFEGQIASSYPTSRYPAWTPRPYSGTNAHAHHIHISVHPTKQHYDDTRPWALPSLGLQEDVMREGDRGGHVTVAQWRINDWLARHPDLGVDVLVSDGVYGPLTAAAVKAIQANIGYPDTGQLDWWTADRILADVHAHPRPSTPDAVAKAVAAAVPQAVKAEIGKLRTVQVLTR